MSNPVNPNGRRVYRPAQEPVYEAVQPVYEQPVISVEPVYEAVQPVVPVQPVYEQPVYQQAVYQQPVVPVAPAPSMDARRSYSQMGDVQVERSRQAFYDQEGNLVEREEQVYDDPYNRRLNVLDRTSRIIYFVMGALELLLALRFLFRVINAETTNGFVNFIYNLSAPFIAPFNGIFNDQRIGQGSVVEVSTLIAMALYVILTYGLIQLLSVLFSPSRSSREVFSTTRRRRY